MLSKHCEAFKFLSRGDRGDYVRNPETGREIVRITDTVNTLTFKCSCFEVSRAYRVFVGYLYGADAISWLTAEPDFEPDFE